MLGYDSGFYLGDTASLTDNDLIAGVRSISGLEEARNVITQEATLKQLSDTMLLGKYTVTPITIVITYDAEYEAEIKKCQDAMRKGELKYFAITKPNSKTGKGGPCFVNKVSPSEVTTEGLMERTIEITPKNAELIVEVTVGATAGTDTEEE